MIVFLIFKPIALFIDLMQKYREKINQSDSFD
nr:MAG TPA: hypothetical protein [Caudoviricetes sp.]